MEREVVAPQNTFEKDSSENPKSDGKFCHISLRCIGYRTDWAG